MLSDRTAFYKRLYFAVAFYNFFAVIIGLIFPSFLPFEASTDQERAILSLLLIGIFIMGIGSLLLALDPLQNYAMAVAILLTKVAGVVFAFWTAYLQSIFPMKYFFLSLINDFVWIPFILVHVICEGKQFFNLVG